MGTGDRADIAAYARASERQRAALADMLEGASFPAAVWSGAEMRFVWMNRAFRDVLDDVRPQWDLLGMPVRGFLSDTRSAVRFIDAAYTGQAVTVPEYEHSPSWGETTYWQLDYLPIPARIDGPFDVLFTAVDVTQTVLARKRAEAELDEIRRAMGLINATILSTLDAEEAMQRVLIEATEVFGADWSWIAERQSGAWVFRNVHGWPEEMIGLRFSDDGPSPPRLAADRMHVVAVGSVEDADGVERLLMERHDIGAMLLVPVLHRGEAAAVLGFCWDAEAGFSAAMLDAAEKLSVSLSLALENARAYEAERAMRRTLQSAFFTAPESVPGLEVGHLFHSASAGATLGRDFYDVVQLADCRVGAAVGSVTERHDDAPAFAALLKSAMRSEAYRLPAPANVLEHADQIVSKHSERGPGATAFFGSIDLSTGMMAYASAGHPGPVLVRPGEEPVLLDGDDAGLGGRPSRRFEVRHAEVGVGDLLVLYTNGAIAARSRSGEPFGATRLARACATHAETPTAEVPQEIFLDLFSYADGRLTEDVAILALRRTAEADSGQQRLELAAV
ncbi:MAG: SpoIIE family protein phosphatase [Anaerosomatales bacterium]|nr:SpoIIE family protein phosphatase [Anaerosomatales bacterium]